MNSPLSDDASLPRNRQHLENEIATIDALLAATEAKIKAAMAEEDPARGIWRAQEIHQLQEDRLVLQTRRTLRQVRIRRLLLEEADA